MRFYGAHPFNARTWFRQWELHLEALFEIQIINPFYDVNREDILAIDNGLKEKYDTNHELIVKADLGLVANADGVIAIVDGSFSIGTSMEMFFAKSMHKPVFVICTNGHEKHPWLRYVAEQIYTKAEDFEQDLEHGLIEVW